MFRRLWSGILSRTQALRNFSRRKRTYTTVRSRRARRFGGGAALLLAGAAVGLDSVLEQAPAVFDELIPPRYTLMTRSAALALQNLPLEIAELTFAPHVPPPITRNYPVHLQVNMEVVLNTLPLDDERDYEFWTFGGGVPGPFIRARVGDVMSVLLKNSDPTGMMHNLDFHSVSGPGGGAPVLTADGGEVRQACFSLQYPGLFIYHCAVGPVGVHMANGMYGLMLVEPEQGLPKVDHEFYVVQSEIYATDTPANPDSKLVEMDYQRGLDENPNYVVFNGSKKGLQGDDALNSNVGDRIRIFFGNAGPNLVSSFHIIGTIFDKVYREGDLISPPARGLQTTLVPAGGATVIELQTPVPGSYALIDHSTWRLEKGAVGFLFVKGEHHADIYHSDMPPKTCPACPHHP